MNPTSPASSSSGPPPVGILGGSGLYAMEGLTVDEERRVETPFGPPSDALVLGELDGRPVVFLARHGRGHRLMPSEIDFRANLYAMKLVGVERILSVSAVGSLAHEYRPGDVVVVDQFVDRTRHRPDTFFGDGIVAHVGFADPVCPELVPLLARAAGEVDDLGVHRGGTYVCMEGPQFSTRAESHLYRSWGMDVIGMTNLQEAKLAREAEICYATLAMVTDYDCWHEEEEEVSVASVLAVLEANRVAAQEILRHALPLLPEHRSGACPCASALAHAVITAPEAISEAARERLRPLLGSRFDPAPVEEGASS